MVRGRSRGSRESRPVPSLFPVSPQTPAMGNTSSERAALERQGGHKTARRDSSGGAKDGDRPKILMDSPEDADIFHSEEIKVLSRGASEPSGLRWREGHFPVFPLRSQPASHREGADPVAALLLSGNLCLITERRVTLGFIEHH